MSPTAIFSLAAPALQYAHDGGVPGWVGEGCTRGGGYRVAGRVLYRYPPETIPGTHIELILRLRPYPWPNEGNSQVNDEVS